MAVIVQKYGGSSVADVQKLHAVAESVAQRVKAGDQIVVVVSAMGKTTDQLLAQAAEVMSSPPQRELDMLVTAGELPHLARDRAAVHRELDKRRVARAAHGGVQKRGGAAALAQLGERGGIGGPGNTIDSP